MTVNHTSLHRKHSCVLPFNRWHNSSSFRLQYSAQATNITQELVKMQSGQGSTNQIIGCLSSGQKILCFKSSPQLCYEVHKRQPLVLHETPECIHNMWSFHIQITFFCDVTPCRRPQYHFNSVYTLTSYYSFKICLILSADTFQAISSGIFIRDTVSNKSRISDS